MYKPAWDWTWGGTTGGSRTCLGGSPYKEDDGTWCGENVSPVFIGCQQESFLRICHFIVLPKNLITNIS